MRRVLIALALLSPVAAQAAELDVTVGGVHQGMPVRVVLMDGRPHETLLNHIRASRNLTAPGDKVTTTFLGLPPGEYDVVAYGDGGQAAKEQHVVVSNALTSLEVAFSQ